MTKKYVLRAAAGDVGIFIDGSADMSDFGAVFSRFLSANSKVLIVTDSNVGALYAAEVAEKLSSLCYEACIHTFKAGEASKTLVTVSGIYEALAGGGFTRSDCIVALGGGVVGDIAGFAAATYMRGIRYYQVPTTLLAQIDSSIGGKTGVDLPFGKNLVGAFYQPGAVYISESFLSTLPEREKRCGFAEAVKYGCISDVSILDDIEGGDLPSVIRKCVAVKTRVVSEDEFDRGGRIILNFGHTVGHAIEKYKNFGGITHGEAVAIGMAYAMRLGIALGVTPKCDETRLTAILKSIGLPAKTDVPLSELSDIMTLDKKSDGGEISFVLTGGLGNSVIKKLTAERVCNILSEVAEN